MAGRIHLGHVYHVAGSPKVTEAAAALVSIPDGALVVDDAGTIIYCGERESLPAERAIGDRRRPPPRFPAARASSTPTSTSRRPTPATPTAAASCWSGSTCASSRPRSRFADPEFAAAGRRRVLPPPHRGRHHRGDGLRIGIPARPGLAVRPRRRRRGLRVVSGRGIQTVGGETAAPLITSEEDAIRLTREEIDKWHGADTGNVDTALLHVAIVPRFSLSVTPETLKNLGELYDSVKDRGVYVHSHLNENNRPAPARSTPPRRPTR